MNKHCVTLFSIVIAALTWVGAAHAENKPASGEAAVGAGDGVHGFDFEFGTWKVHHRARRPTGEWREYEGTCTTRPIMGGAGNVEEHQIDKPEGSNHGVAMRAYDAKTGQWAIWWIDSRNPHGPLDPPVMGRFENGVGTFYSDQVYEGKPMRTRFIWSHITPTSARWEQAYSYDAGKTWDVNWIMEFTRTQPK